MIRGAPGLTLMSEVERLMIVEGLEGNAERIKSELQRLPITLKSKRLQDKKSQLEQELAKIERDMDKFRITKKIWIPKSETAPNNLRTEVGESIEKIDGDGRVEVQEFNVHTVSSPPLSSNRNSSQRPVTDQSDVLVAEFGDQLEENILKWIQ
jgi:hypothetical protein